MWVWAFPNRLLQETICRPLGGASRSNFYTRYRDWPSAASQPNRDGVPKKCYWWTFKIWPKNHRFIAYNFGNCGSNLKKLFHPTCWEAGVIIWVQRLEGPPNNIWEGKNFQNSAQFLTTLYTGWPNKNRTFLRDHIFAAITDIIMRFLLKCSEITAENNKR